MGTTHFSGPVYSANGFYGPTYTYATLPAASSVAAGTQFWTSDQGMQVSTGSVWQAVASASVNLSSSNTAAQNTALIQAALNSKVCIINTPGDYYYNGTLVIPSDSYFYVGSGVQLLRTGMTNNSDAVKTLVNENWNSTTYTASGTVQGVAQGGAGLAFVYNVTIPLASGHGITAVGQYILIKGDITKVYNGVYKVTSFTSTSVTVVMYASSGGMPAASGTITVERADANITVEVKGYIDGRFGDPNQSITNGIDGLDSMGLIFNKVGNLRIPEYHGGGYTKYVILCANVINPYFGWLDFHNRSDGIHFQPSWRNVSIESVTGQTGDDLIAFTTLDYSMYRLSSVFGETDGIEIKSAKPSGCANVVALYPGGVYEFKTVVLNELNTNNSSGCTVNISSGSDQSFTATTQASSNILTSASGFPTYYSNVVGFFVSGAGIPDNTYVISQNTSAGTVTLSASATSSNTATTITMSGAGQVDDVTITNSTGSTSGAGMVQLQAATVGSLTLNDVKNPKPDQHTDFSISCTWTSGATVLTAASGAATGVLRGMEFICDALPAGAIVTSVSGATINISAATTTTQSTAKPVKFRNKGGHKRAIVKMVQEGRIANLIINKSVIDLDCTNSAYDRSILKSAGSNTTVGNVFFNNVVITGIGASASYSVILADRAKNVVMEGCTIRGYGNIVDGGQIAIDLKVNDLTTINCQFITGSLATGSSVAFDNLNAISSDATLLNFYGTARTYNLSLRGIKNSSGQALINYSTHTLNLNASDATVSVDGTKITPSTGALFYNTNAAYGTGVGVYVYGTSAAVKLTS